MYHLLHRWCYSFGIAELEASDADDRARSLQDQAANEAAQVARERADQLWKLYGARQEKQDLEEQLQGASDAHLER